MIGVLKSAKEAAKEAFMEGQQFFDGGQFKEAAVSFRHAMQLAPTWKIYYNIAHSEAASRNYGLALEAFQGDLTQCNKLQVAGRRSQIITNLVVML